MSSGIDEIIGEVLVKFPDTPTMTLAKMIYEKHPKSFTSLDACRSAVRYRRGNIGERNRKKRSSSAGKELFRPNQTAGYSMDLPKSIASPIKDFKVPQGLSLVISDGHVPFHDDIALRSALDYGSDREVDNVILNGDMIDFFSVSRWEKNPEERNMSRELQLARQFLQHLRERFPNARIIYKIGNHEERWEKYMYTKAPEICGVADFQIYKLLDFAKYGIEEVKSKQKMKSGKNLTIIHGHELFQSNAPVNFARTLQQNLGVCAIAGHRHNTSEHSQKNADNKYITCWSLGCLCDMSPEYAIINKWNHGFAMLDLIRNDFHVDNKRIIDGKVL